MRTNAMNEKTVRRAGACPPPVLAVLLLLLGGVAHASTTIQHGYAKGWNLVSVPLYPTNPTVSAVFDELNPVTVYDYTGGQLVGVNEGPAAVTAGKAYWALFPQATTVSVTGDLAPLEQEYRTNIAPGWNFIGVPWRSNVAWSDARVSVYNLTTTVPLGQAVTSGWIEGDLRGIDPATESYQVLAANGSGSLKPWFGYILFSTIDGQVIFSAPPSDTTLPHIEILSPPELFGDGDEIRSLKDVIGTAEDDNLVGWTLEYEPQETGVPTTIATGDTPVTAAVVGQLDPTLQLNGIGKLILTGEDEAGNIAFDEKTVVLGGDNKLGNFRLTFIDLEVPVAGIPISVRRTYDTRRRDAALDYGFGWQLEVFAAGKYLENRKPGEGWSFTHSGIGGCTGADPTLSHVTEIRISDREFYRFAPIVTNVTGAIDCFGKVKFVQVGGLPGAQLADLEENDPDNPQGIDIAEVNGDIVDPDTGETYEPREVRMRTLDGRKLDLSLLGSPGLDRPRGLYRVEDRNGSVLDIKKSGAFWHNESNPTVERSIQIVREPGTDRVIQLIDPMGKIIPYTYNASGELETVSDRTSNTTTFHYTAGHFLSEIVDALNHKPIRPQFDGDGRLVAWKDADGNETSFVTDVLAGSIEVTDRLGHASTYEYGSDGFLLTATQPGNIQTHYTYDTRGNVLTEEDPLGHTTSYQYDGNDQLRFVTDPLNHTTEYRYEDPSNPEKVTKVIQPLGNTTENVYEAGTGNLTKEIDALGKERDYTYNAQGLRATESLFHAAGQPATCVTTMTYDDFGELTQTTDALGNVMDYTYDGNGRQVTETVHRTPAPGQPQVAETTTMTYDDQGRLLTREDPLHNVTAFGYDAAGRQTTETDALLRVTTMQYDQRNNLDKRIDPDTHFEQYVYDLEGRRTTSIDRLGRTTFTFYDDLGRLEHMEYPDGTEDHSFYDDAGRLIARKDARDHITSFGYDDAGRQTTVTDAQEPVHGVTTNDYDDNGRLLTVTDALNHVTTFTYDLDSRRKKTIFHDATFTETGYDDAGRATTQQDQNGKVTTYGYDCLGRLASVTTPMTHTWAYGYDEVGNLVTQTDANSHTTEMRYDALRRLTNRILPMGQIDSKIYDAVGNLRFRTDFNGVTTELVYDNLNRLTDKIYPPGNGTTADVHFTYTLTSQRQAMTDGIGLTQYVYDDRDRLQSITDPFSRTITYTYDPAGNRASVTVPSGTTSYTYDEVNRMKTVTDSDGGLYNYGYNLVGFKTSMSYPNGVVATYTPDNLNRLHSIEHRRSNGDLIAGFTYAVDNTGNRTAVDEAGEIGARHVDWGYDDEYKLTSETMNAPTPKAISFQYDNVGNRLKRFDGGVQAQDLVYDADDRTIGLNGTSFLYDANGNTLADQANGYSWNLEDRLLSVVGGGHSLANSCNGDGTRLATTADGTSTHYVTDSNSQYTQVLEERGTTGSLTAAYTLGHGLLRQMRAGTESFYLADAVPSTRALTSSTGTLTDAYNYEAFGGALTSVGVTPNGYQFAGQELVHPGGLYNLRTRILASSLGRFLTRDPSVGHTATPLSLHSYLYVGADPVNRTDPTGRDWTSDPSLGEQVEDYVCESYEDDHPDNEVECGKWQMGLPLKPDVFDKDDFWFLEVKPWSIPGRLKGAAQIIAYTAAFADDGYLPNPFYLPYPSQVRFRQGGGPVWVQLFNIGGVIFYTGEKDIIDEYTTLGQAAFVAQYQHLKSIRQIQGIHSLAIGGITALGALGGAPHVISAPGYGSGGFQIIATPTYALPLAA